MSDDTDSAPPPEVVAPAVDIDIPVPDQPFFDRGYVDSIRKDAVRYRTEANAAAAKAAQYEQVFGAYAPEDQQVWFDLATTWAQDPSRAAQVMQQIATGVLGEMNQDQTPYQQQAVADAMVDVPDEGLTPDKVREIVEASFQTREQAAREQRDVENVMAEVRSHGYDPDSAEGFMVLWNANHETNGDISKAAEMVKGYRQSVIDDYVAGRTSGRVAVPTANGVQATSAPEPIKNLEDARRATDAFLRERQGAR